METKNTTQGNKSKKLKTSISFTTDELSALARYISAGTVFLQTSHPVTAKIKAALTRLGLPKPKGF